MWARIAFCLAGVLAAAPVMAGEAVRIASWRIAGSLPEALRSGSDSGSKAKHSAAELEALRGISAALGADVIALQSVGSPQAVRQLFPAGEFHLVFSRQLLEHVSEGLGSADNPKLRGAYTAIVVRRGRDVRVQRIEQLGDLADGEEDQTDSRLLSAGLAVELRASGVKFWVLSVDLAELCQTASGDQQAATACRAGGHRVAVLKDWIRARLWRHESFIVAGSMPGDPADKDGFGDAPAAVTAGAPIGSVRVIQPIQAVRTVAKPELPGAAALVGVGKIAERTKQARKKGAGSGQTAAPAPPDAGNDSILSILVESVLDVVFGIDTRKTKREHPPEQAAVEAAKTAGGDAETPAANAPPASAPEPAIPEPAQLSPAAAQATVRTGDDTSSEPAGQPGKFLLYSAVDAGVSCAGKAAGPAAVGAAKITLPRASDYFLMDPALAERFAVSGIGIVPHAAAPDAFQGPDAAAVPASGCPIFVELNP